jgi:hypothetical protein
MAPGVTDRLREVADIATGCRPGKGDMSMRLPWKDSRDPKLAEAERAILRALNEAKRDEIRRARGPFPRRVLAFIFPLGVLVSITAVAVAPFELLGIWHLWWTPYASCALWTGLMVWLGESQRGKRLLDRYNSN